MTIFVMVSLLAAQACAAASGSERFSPAMESGRSQWEVGDYGKARADFAAAETLASTPADKAHARLWIGHCQYQLGQYRAARSLYTAVLGIQGASKDDLFYAYQHLGHMYVQEEDFPAALTCYRDAIEKVGPRPSLRHNGNNDIAFAYHDQNNLAYRQYRLGRYAQAREAYRAALNMPGIADREKSDAWLHTGHCWFSQRQYDRARGEYEKVLAIQTLCPDGWHRSEAALYTGRSYREEGHREEAVRALRGVLLLDARPGHRRQACDLLNKLGEKATAGVGGAMDAQYGAECNPTGDPIGGGAGYRRTIRSGDYAVSTLDELTRALDALAQQPPVQRRGKVVLVQPGATIRLAGTTGIRIPSGVTLAGNRGHRGAPSRICADRHLDADWVFVIGAEARLTGLHLCGDALPFTELFGMWPQSYFPVDFYRQRKQPRPRITAVMCDDKAEVDNCEIERFQSGIACQGGGIHVHHNRLHDIHAYPVLVSRSASLPLVEANAIDWAWHAIAAVDDMCASYEVRFNVFREVAPNLWGQAISG
jgi:tetratricopeptide (TPR) repeat protein